MKLVHWIKSRENSDDITPPAELWASSEIKNQEGLLPEGSTVVN